MRKLDVGKGHFYRPHSNFIPQYFALEVTLVAKRNMPYPPHILVNEFALRSFRETADKDYVHARLAHRAKLLPQFLWSSLHCLEKYIKCILLLNRIDARDIKHEVITGLARLESQGKFRIELSKIASDFVTRLEDGARFRYYESSYDAESMDLPRLDRTVWEVRRYCQPLDYVLDAGASQVSQLQSNLERIRADLNPMKKNSCISNGWLEKVMQDKSHSARNALIWKNLFFGNNHRKSISVPGFEEFGNSPLYVHPETVYEVEKYIYLPNEVKKGYRELHKQRSQGSM